MAEEVGKLAQMSGGAANEIADLLQLSTGKVNQIVEGTRTKIQALVADSRRRSTRGTELAGACERSLEQAVAKVETVSRLMEEIAGAAKEQSIGVSEITKAMNLLDQTTQKNSSTADTAADLARELEEKATELNGSISELERRIGVGRKREGVNSGAPSVQIAEESQRAAA